MTVREETGSQCSDGIKVLFIGGFGRSGSTLLELLLAQLDDFVAVGEVRYIWWRSLKENHLCGCGQAFRSCQFWRNVIDEAFGGVQNLDVDGIQDLWRSTERIRYIRELTSRDMSAAYRRRFEQYAQIEEKLFRAIAVVSRKKVIVDSSKVPSHGFVLNALANIDLNVLHLVRDSRAVAFSWMKRKRIVQSQENELFMPRYSLSRSEV